MVSNSKKTIQIHVRLIDEPVEVWRPTLAELVREGVFRVLPTSDYDPNDEEWEFVPGTLVSIQERVDEEGSHLVAVSIEGL